MNDDFEFLEYIYQNSKIAQETIGRIVKTRNLKDDLDNILKDILENYKKISNSSKLMIQRRKKEVRDISIISKMVTYMSIKKNMESDDSIDEIIRMLTQNISAGIEEIEKKVKDSKLKNKTIINLANRFIEVEKENLEKIKEKALQK